MCKLKVVGLHGYLILRVFILFPAIVCFCPMHSNQAFSIKYPLMGHSSARCIQSIYCRRWVSGQKYALINVLFCKEILFFVRKKWRPFGKLQWLIVSLAVNRIIVFCNLAKVLLTLHREPLYTEDIVYIRESLVIGRVSFQYCSFIFVRICVWYFSILMLKTSFSVAAPALSNEGSSRCGWPPNSTVV